MNIKQAGIEDLDLVAPLFYAYLDFYEQNPDMDKATDYIRQRLINNESIIFLALDDDDRPLGFTQLYPTFCSVEMIKIFVLYDLFVSQTARNQGVGRALLDRARRQARLSGVRRIDLQTAQDNDTAQSLYKAFGYEYSNEYQNWSYYVE